MVAGYFGVEQGVLCYVVGVCWRGVIFLPLFIPDPLLNFGVLVVRYY